MRGIDDNPRFPAIPAVEIPGDCTRKSAWKVDQRRIARDSASNRARLALACQRERERERERTSYRGHWLVGRSTRFSGGIFPSDSGFARGRGDRFNQTGRD